MKWLEIKFWQLAKHIIKKGYGSGCDTYEERCPECRSTKVVEWIDDHISLLKFF